MQLSSSPALKRSTHRGRTARLPEIRAGWSPAIFAHWLDRPSLTFYLTALVFVGSLLLGGGTRGGFVSDTLLQLLSLPILLYFLSMLATKRLNRQLKAPLFFCLALVGLPILQLAPLPPWLWTRMANGASSVFEITGQAAPWMPLSASPQSTLLALLSFIPPLAVFFGAVQLTYRERRWLSLVLIGVGIFSVFLGLIQVAQGPASELRFFEVTNPSEAVGFFANRNHFAAFIYCVFLFAVARTMPSATEVGVKLSQRQFDVASILKALAGFTVLVVLLAGETMARSRAGLALTIVALVGALLIGLAYQSVFSLSGGNLRDRFRVDRLLSVSPTKLLAVALAVTVIFSLQYALFRVQERFQADPVDDARLVFIPNTIEAAKAYLPFGSGLGSFVSVYLLFDKPESTLANTFANHAHNDAVEAALETGIFGLVLMALFVTWLAYRSAAAWSGPLPRGASDLDQTLARAATIAIGLLLAHSLVDYPLRTGAMAAVFAFACALLIPPSMIGDGSTELAAVEDAQFSPEPSLPIRRPSQVRPQPKTRDVPAPRKRQWGSDINWPKEWTTQGSPPGKGDKDPQT